MSTSAGLPEGKRELLPEIPPPLPDNPSHPWPELQQFARAVLNQNIQGVIESARSNRRAFGTLYFMYIGLFFVGIGTAVAGIVRSFVITSSSDGITVLSFAGLTAASFFTLFLVRPLDSMERDRIFSSWLTAATNTYWTRLMFFSSSDTIDKDLVAANDELIANLSTLADKYAVAVGKYSALESAGKTTAGQTTGNQPSGQKTG